MEFIECESVLGHPRRMGFAYEDIEQAQRRLNGPLVGLPSVAGAERALNVRLWMIDSEVISHLAFVGMHNFDPNMTREKAKEVIQACNVRYKDPFEFVKLIDKALKAGGHMPEEQISKEAKDAQKQAGHEAGDDRPLTRSSGTD